MQEALSQLPANLLLAVKLKNPYQDFVKALEEAPADTLAQLPRGNKQLAFWINTYNAFVQILLDKDPGLFGHKNRFFQSKHIRIAGHGLSLDNIEHGILRRSRFKYGFGYLPKLFPSPFERKHRLGFVDPRIHFALNCAAQSCPPISVYQAEAIDHQLDTASLSYLEQEIHFDPSTQTLFLPKIMFWFRGDFGGQKGIQNFLENYRLWPEAPQVKIRYRDYDWTQLSHNFE